MPFETKSERIQALFIYALDREGISRDAYHILQPGQARDGLEGYILQETGETGIGAWRAYERHGGAERAMGAFDRNREPVKLIYQRLVPTDRLLDVRPTWEHATGRRFSRDDTGAVLDLLHYALERMGASPRAYDVVPAGAKRTNEEYRFLEQQPDGSWRLFGKERNSEVEFGLFPHALEGAELLYDQMLPPIHGMWAYRAEWESVTGLEF